MTTATHYTTATAAAACGSVVVFSCCDKEEKNAKTKPHEPGFKLTHEERMKKCDQHKYGVCVTCDVGLDDRADFTCDPRMPGGFSLMCHSCFDYFNKNGYVSCGYGAFSNAAYR